MNDTLAEAVRQCKAKPFPPDTTTLALVSSGRSLLVRLCLSHSDIPAGEGEATATERTDITKNPSQNAVKLKCAKYSLHLHLNMLLGSHNQVLKTSLL